MKDLVGELKNFEVQILVLEYKKIDDHKSIHKIFHWSAKLIANDHKLIHKMLHWSAKFIANDSDIDKTFGSMHQSIITKKKLC